MAVIFKFTATKTVKFIERSHNHIWIDIQSIYQAKHLGCNLIIHGDMPVSIVWYWLHYMYLYTKYINLWVNTSMHYMIKWLSIHRYIYRRYKTTRYIIFSEKRRDPYAWKLIECLCSMPKWWQRTDIPVDCRQMPSGIRHILHWYSRKYYPGWIFPL